MVATALPILKKIADGENLGVVRGKAASSPFQRGRPQWAELREAAEAEYQEIYRLAGLGQRGRTMILRREVVEPFPWMPVVSVSWRVPSLVWSMLAIGFVALASYTLLALTLTGPLADLTLAVPASLAFVATGLGALNLGLLRLWANGSHSTRL